MGQMHFRVANEPWVLRSYVPELMALAGGDVWARRTSQIRNACASSPYLSQIASDYHWVELQLSDELEHRKLVGASPDDPLNPISQRALRFAQTTTEVHKVLSPSGKRILEGRVRDALRAETGFAALYQEMEVAALLVSQDFDVEFPDLNGSGRADIAFQKGPDSGLIECKSLSADSGRKIHRKPFYRFMEAISEELALRASTRGVDELILITLKDRLPSNHQQVNPLLQATKEFLLSPKGTHNDGTDFTIRRSTYSALFGNVRDLPEPQLLREAQKQFGADCHIAGLRSEHGRCLIMMRSDQPDDTSKTKLEAMKEAAKQLSSDKPSFIALQFNDICSTDVALPHLRERCGLLSGFLFHEYPADHVAAIYICAFGATSVTADIGAYPGLAIWNPRFKFSRRGLPFQVGVTDDAFSKILHSRMPRHA